MNYQLAALLVSVGTSLFLVAKALWNIWRDSKQEAKEVGLTIYNAAEVLKLVEAMQAALKDLDARSLKQVADLYEALRQRGEAENERYHEFYREFSDFRFQVARYMKNGGHA